MQNFFPSSNTSLLSKKGDRWFISYLKGPQCYDSWNKTYSFLALPRFILTHICIYSHCKWRASENQYKCLVPIYAFPEMKLRGRIISKTEFQIHVSVSDIPKIGLPIMLKPNRQTNRSQVHGNRERCYRQSCFTKLAHGPPSKQTSPPPRTPSSSVSSKS